MRGHTPMLRQYFELKEERPEVLLAMRVGDFYEFYGEDAETAASQLEITLTGREDGPNGKVAMAGVPYHSVEKYLARLMAKGLKVALCDQLEDPKQAKGLVKRGVTRVLTPGTVLEESMLPSRAANILACFFEQGQRIGLATVDVGAAEFMATEWEGPDARDRLLQELSRLQPREILFDTKAAEWAGSVCLALEATASKRSFPSLASSLEVVKEQFAVHSLAGFGIDDSSPTAVAAAAIIEYSRAVAIDLSHIGGISSYDDSTMMRIDPTARFALELTRNMVDGTARFTLLGVLDQCLSPMGSRTLRKWIEQPLLQPSAIKKRLDAVERLASHSQARGDIRATLKAFGDLERLTSRASTGLAGPRDLTALRSALWALPGLDGPLSLVGLGRLQELRTSLGDHSELALRLQNAIVDEPTHVLRDGGVIRTGFDAELDRLRENARDGREFIATLEAEERLKTGLNTLKVGFNSVFGYYLEVPKSQVSKVPDGYIRKQTTANAERYITAELKERESQVLGSEEKAGTLEADLFARIRTEVAAQAKGLLQTARALGELDALASLGEVAVSRRYVRPEMVEEDVFEFQGGRHPVVEANEPDFVPNDLSFPAEGARLAILTGPNMAGKSTYLRQAALVAIMAQMGSFVPAKRCRLGVCDRVFARIGARDQLAVGQSTFMVEMVEAANILNHATAKSLVILDEIGRGTSTYDGLAIAWAITEYLVEIGAKTLFATHYHQLNSLAEQIPAVKNMRMEVEEIGDDVAFTHRVAPGGTDKSYGIHVARMAGAPKVVLERAQQILSELEGRAQAIPSQAEPTKRLQFTLFELEDPAVVQELKNLDLDRLTPIDALKVLDDWKRKFGG